MVDLLRHVPGKLTFGVIKGPSHSVDIQITSVCHLWWTIGVIYVHFSLPEHNSGLFQFVFNLRLLIFSNNYDDDDDNNNNKNNTNNNKSNYAL